MGVTCFNGKELDEKTTKDNEKNVEEFKQESDRDSTISEREMKFEKVTENFPLNLDVVCAKRTSRYWPESCPLGSDLDLATFATLLNYIKNLGWNSTYSEQYKSSFSFNLRLSKFIYEDLINPRKTRSLNDTVSLLSERSVIDSIENLALRHSGWCKLDAFQENAKAFSIFKRSLLAHLSFLNDVIDQPRSISPLLVGNASFQNSNSESSSISKEASEAKLSKMKLISSPSSYSTFSCQSTSITKGQLHCFQKGGMPYFIFSVDDAPQVIYMASSQKIKSSSEKDIDSMYLFYFKGSKNSESKKHSMNSTCLIAKMKVSSSIVLTPNRLKIMETQFVLYGCQEEVSNKLQKTSSIVSVSKGFPRNFAEIFRQNNVGMIKPKDKVNEKRFNGLDDINESSLANDVFVPNLELAAIVVQQCFQDTTNDLIFGGWGLKFLEKASHKNTSTEPSFSTCSSKNPSYKDEFARSLNVLIPADLHGGPVAEHGGPASIIARWRSAGHCDCGGWDIGCPLKVLNQRNVHSSAPAKDSEKKPVNLFIEGTKNGGQPTLIMNKMTEGLYSIYFQSSLSVLQSFSIAVAAIHKNC